MVETQLIASLRRNTKKGEHNYYKGEHKVRPYGLCVIEWFVLGIGGWGLCGAQNQLRITNYELRVNV